MTAKRFPWGQVLHAGLGRMKLAPKDFWAMTPRELAAALMAPEAQPLTRARLLALMEEYPDG